MCVLEIFEIIKRRLMIHANRGDSENPRTFTSEFEVVGKLFRVNSLWIVKELLLPFLPLSVRRFTSVSVEDSLHFSFFLPFPRPRDRIRQSRFFAMNLILPIKTISFSFSARRVCLSNATTSQIFFNSIKNVRHLRSHRNRH